MTAISVAPLSALPLLKDLPALLPELTLLVTAIGLLCSDMFFPRERAFLQWLTVVGAVVSLAAIVAVSAGGGRRLCARGNRRRGPTHPDQGGDARPYPRI